jgi:hypothetical protein
MAKKRGSSPGHGMDLREMLKGKLERKGKEKREWVEREKKRTDRVINE